MPLFTKFDNPDAALIRLFKLLGLSITDTEIINELNIHPDYPNLLALNDVLNNFGVESAAYRIEDTELENVPFPFIAHTRKAGAEFLVVKSKDAQAVTLADQNSTGYQMSLTDFLKIFDGVVLVPEKTDLPTAKATHKFAFEEVRYPLAIGLLIVVLLAAIAFYSPIFLTWQIGTAALFKTCGLIVSILLLIQSIDKSNPLVQTLCGGDEKTNCNAILSSKAANVFEGLSWSEVGFFYFAGTWLALLFGSGSLALLQVLAILNIVSLPYTVYSIYYQAKVAKQWCVFCCAVQALLWLEFIPLVTTLIKPLQWIETTGWAGLIISLILPVVAWLFLKPVFLKAQQLKPLKGQLRNFKYNSELFYALLKEQPKYATPNQEWSIVLGNPDAENIITMVSNPYCQPCAKTHAVLDDWLNHNPNLQARVVFTAKNADWDSQTPVVKHLMALNNLEDKAIVKQALHDWYEQKQKSFAAWSAAYPVQVGEAEILTIEKQMDWCNLAEIKATPTLLVNGYVLPNTYQIKDIKYMLE